MRRLILRWVGLAIFVAVVATTCVFLARWQLHRLDERRATNERIISAQEGQVLEFADVFTTTITDDNQWQRVRVTGTYLPEHTVVIRDRRQDNTSGVAVVTPLRTTSGEVLFVDRGYLGEVDRSLSGADAPKPPSGEVTLIGLSRRNERGPDNATVPDDQHRARLIRSDTYGEAFGLAAVDGYLDVTESDPADDPRLVPTALPELSDGPHFWYAMQWFLFGGLAVIGLVWFVRSDIRARRPGTSEEDVLDEEESVAGQ